MATRMTKEQHETANRAFLGLLNCGALERLRESASDANSWDDVIGYHIKILTGVTASPGTVRHMRLDMARPIYWSGKNQRENGELCDVSVGQLFQEPKPEPVGKSDMTALNMTMEEEEFEQAVLKIIQENSPKSRFPELHSMVA